MAETSAGGMRVHMTTPRRMMNIIAPHRLGSADCTGEPTSDSRRAFGSRWALALYPFPTPVDFLCIQLASVQWLMPGAELSGLGQCPVRPIHRFRPVLFQCAYSPI